MNETPLNDAISVIVRGYHRGLSLSAIIASVPNDDATLRLVGYQLGISMKTVRRIASENKREENRK